jgi:hypothetical protein
MTDIKEKRICIKFSFGLGSRAVEICKMLKEYLVLRLLANPFKEMNGRQ